LRRHWLPVFATTALFVALIAGLAGVVWQAHRASVEAARAAATRDFLIEVFKASDPRIAQDKPRGQITARELLDASVVKIDREFANDPPTQIQLLGIAADIYRELGEDERYENLHKHYIAMARRQYGEEHPIVLAALLSDASRATENFNGAAARRELDVLDPIIRRAGLDHSALRARWWLTFGQALFEDTSKSREQIAALKKAADLAAEVAPEDPVRVTALADLGNAYASRMDFVPARSYMEQAIAVAAHVKNRDDAELATIYSNLGLISVNSGDFERADSAYAQAGEILKKTYGESGSHSWPAAAYRARAAHLGGNRERATTLFSALLKTLPADPVNHDATEAREWYAGCLAAEGRAAEALPFLESAERLYRSTRLYDFQLPRVRATLGDAYARVGRVDDARDLLKAALDQRVASDPPDFQPVLAIRERWGRFLLTQGEVAAAEAQFKEVVLQAHVRPLSHAALAHGGLARVALARADNTGALAESEQAIRMYEHVTGFRDVRMGPYLWLIHSEVLRKVGERQGARDWAQRALDASRRYDDPTAASIAEAQSALQLAAGGRTS
jgi:serine/threonine-protein kinase